MAKKKENDNGLMDRMVYNGLDSLTKEEKVKLIEMICNEYDLNAALGHIQVIKKSNRNILYITKSGANHLMFKNQLSSEITNTAMASNILSFRVRVYNDKRSVENVGVMHYWDGIKSDELSNRIMACHTKAVRRAVIAFCGLGVLDETELDFKIKDDMLPEKFMKMEMQQIEQVQQDINTTIDKAANKINHQNKMNAFDNIQYVKNEHGKIIDENLTNDLPPDFDNVQIPPSTPPQPNIDMNKVNHEDHVNDKCKRDDNILKRSKVQVLDFLEANDPVYYHVVFDSIGTMDREMLNNIIKQYQK